MPLRVNGYVYTLLPGRSPWYIRPLVRMVANTLTSQLITPALKTNLDFVSKPPTPNSKLLITDFDA